MKYLAVLLMIFSLSACKDAKNKDESARPASDELKALVLANQAKEQQAINAYKSAKTCAINEHSCEDQGVIFSISNTPIEFMKEAHLKIISPKPLKAPKIELIGLNMDLGRIEVELDAIDSKTFEADFIISTCLMGYMMYRMQLIDEGKVIASIDFNMRR